MHLAVYLALLAALAGPSAAVPAAGRFLADHLPPSTAARLLAAATVLLAACSTLALAVLAVAGVVAWEPSSSRAARSVLHDDPAALPAGVTAGIVLTVLLVRTGLTARRLAAEYRSAARAVPPGSPPGGVLLVAGAAGAARALPVRGGHVLVGAEMWQELTPTRRAAVLAHEHAHLTRRHHLYAAATDLAVALNPLTSPLRRALGYALERWADEDAADTTGDRGSVARTLGAVALRAPSPARGTAALTITGGVVPRRVAALLRPRPTGDSVRGTAVAVTLVLTVAAAVALAGHAAGDLGEMLDRATPAGVAAGQAHERPHGHHE